MREEYNNVTHISVKLKYIGLSLILTWCHITEFFVEDLIYAF